MAPEKKPSPHTLEENSFPRILPRTPGKGLREELAKCENCVRIATYTDTVVKTQCTYTLDSPLSPGGLFINLSTFLPVSLDALPLDCLLRPIAENTIDNPAADGASLTSGKQQQQQQEHGQQQQDMPLTKMKEKDIACISENSNRKEGNSGSAAETLIILKPQQRLYVHVQSSVDRDQAVSLGRALISGRKKDAGPEKGKEENIAVGGSSPAGQEDLGVKTTTTEGASACITTGGIMQQPLCSPTKLALGTEGGFPVEEEYCSGDACPTALTRTFRYCLAVLPQQLHIHPVAFPCAAVPDHTHSPCSSSAAATTAPAAGATTGAAAAAPATGAAAAAPATGAAAAAPATGAAGATGATVAASSTPLSLYSRCMPRYCSIDDDSSDSRLRDCGEKIQQLLHAQEAWEKELLKQILFLPLDSPDVPEKIRTACNAVVEHRGSSAPAAAAATASGGAVAWEEEIQVSKHAATLVQTKNPPTIGPSGWRCADCGALTNLWLNLSDGFIGCGRRLYGVGGGCLDGREGAAIRHYIETGKKYPLIVKLGTITPHTADVYSYAEDEDCCVIDPLLPHHLSHFGVNVQQLSKTEKSTNEIALDWNVQHEWSRATEANTELRACSGADYIGLRNMGNSCYINSVVQVFTSIPELREKYVSLFPVLLASLPYFSEKDENRERKKKTTAGLAAADFLLQHSSLAVALHTNRYPLQDRRRKAVIVQDVKKYLSAAMNSNISSQFPGGKDIDETNDIFKNIAYLDTDSVTPQVYRHLVGLQHSEFATLHQQDAEEFLSLLIQWLSNRDVEAQERVLAAKRRLQLLQEGRIESSTQQQREKKKEDQEDKEDNVQKEKEIQDIEKEEEKKLKEILAAVGCTGADISRAEKALEKSHVDKLFSFVVEQRIQCSTTQQVRYSYIKQQVLSLPVPMDPSIQEEFEVHQQALQKEEEQRKKRLRCSGHYLREDFEEATQLQPASQENPEMEKKNETETAPSLPTYTFSECISAFLAPTFLTDYHSSATGRRGEAIKHMRLATFPPYLLIQLKRFFADQHWQAKKLYCPVLVSEDLDVANMRGTGLQEGEVELPEEELSGGKRQREEGEEFAKHAGSSSRSCMQFDPELLKQLTSMGFTENACKRASLAVQSSSPDACIEWLMAHVDDPDLNASLPSHYTSETTTDPATLSHREDAADSFPGGDEAISLLTSMGFTEKQARAGFLAVTMTSSGSSSSAMNTGSTCCDRAADWLLNHSEDLDAAVEEVLKKDAEQKKKKKEEAEQKRQHDMATEEAKTEEETDISSPLQKMMKGLDDGSSQYTLYAFITHIGKNASCGHYVGHIKRGNKWILFNDEKVAEAVNPPVDLGYIYVFKRKDLLEV